MAFNTSLLHRDVTGKMRLNQYSCVADAASDSISTGFEYVYAISATPKSMTTAAGKFKMNVLTAGTAAPGFIAVTGIASGDEFYLNVWGR